MSDAVLPFRAHSPLPARNLGPSIQPHALSGDDRRADTEPFAPRENWTASIEVGARWSVDQQAILGVQANAMFPADPIHGDWLVELASRHAETVTHTFAVCVMSAAAALLLQIAGQALWWILLP